MLSVAKCKNLLGSSDLTDAEIERLRNQLYGLAEMMVINFKTKLEQPEAIVNLVPQIDQDNVVERAAMNEAEGNISRHKSEKRAVIDYWKSNKYER
jgi:hypothetical protein